MKFLAYLFLALNLSASAFALIGGKTAKQWEIASVLASKGEPNLEAEIFPSVVLLEMGCTGTVVGPRHLLTAAHCVVNDFGDRAVREEFNPGEPLRFHTKVQFEVQEPFESSYSHSVKIARTLVHASYLHAGLSENFPENTGDIAILIVDRDIGTKEVTKANLEKGLLPIAEISFAALDAGTKVVKLGYGCESIAADSVQISSHWRLKYATVELPHQTEALRKAATYEKIQFRDVFDDFYWISRGYFFDEKNPGDATICPGDSGGPLYAGNRVVGVNSRSRIGKVKEGVTGVAIDFHTRLDRETPLRVDRWTELALTFPMKKWYQGVAYFSVVPRAIDFKNELETKTREDLRVTSKAWLAFADGIGGACPLKFGRIVARDEDGHDHEMKHVREATQMARVETNKKITPASFKITMEADESLRRERHAPICYISLLALE